MTEFSEQVEEYIKQDRQWLRHCRIAKAKTMLDKEALNTVTYNFWRAVLQRNED